MDRIMKLNKLVRLKMHSMIYFFFFFYSFEPFLIKSDLLPVMMMVFPATDAFPLHLDHLNRACMRKM